jgi:hypothetical protein
MFVTSSADRAGLLVAVISGGRPRSSSGRRPASSGRPRRGRAGRRLGRQRAARGDVRAGREPGRHVLGRVGVRVRVGALDVPGPAAGAGTASSAPSPAGRPPAGRRSGADAGASSSSTTTSSTGTAPRDPRREVDRQRPRRARVLHRHPRRRRALHERPDGRRAARLDREGAIPGRASRVPLLVLHRAGRARPGGVVRPVRGRHHHAIQYGDRADGATPRSSPCSATRRRPRSTQGRRDALRDARPVRARPVEAAPAAQPAAAKVMVKRRRRTAAGRRGSSTTCPPGRSGTRSWSPTRSSTAGSRRPSSTHAALEDAEREGNREKARLRLEAHRKAGGRRVPAATPEKDQEALRYRLGGFSYDEIAQRLGYRNKSGAWKAVERALASGPADADAARSSSSASIRSSGRCSRRHSAGTSPPRSPS